MRAGICVLSQIQGLLIVLIPTLLLCVCSVALGQEGDPDDPVCTEDTDCSVCEVCDETGNCVSNGDPDCDPFETGPECQVATDCGGCGDCVEGSCVFSFVNENGCYTPDDCPDDFICYVQDDPCENYCGSASTEGGDEAPDDPDLDTPEGLCGGTGGTWNECGSGCGPVTCENFENFPEECLAVCVALCECPEDKVWSGEFGCFPSSSCGASEEEGGESPEEEGGESPEEEGGESPEEEGGESPEEEGGESPEEEGGESPEEEGGGESPMIQLCADTNGTWNACGSGCGPIVCGQIIPDEEPDCPEVCIELCECPEDKPFWSMELGCLAEEDCPTTEEGGEATEEGGEATEEEGGEATEEEGGEATEEEGGEATEEEGGEATEEEGGEATEEEGGEASEEEGGGASEEEDDGGCIATGHSGPLTGLLLMAAFVAIGLVSRRKTFA